MSGTVIIGASHSGVTLADLLRKGEYKEDIHIIDKDDYFPVERPPLSKSFLWDNEQNIDNKILLRTEDWYKSNKIKYYFGLEVLKIDREKNNVILIYRKVQMKAIDQMLSRNFKNISSLDQKGIDLDWAAT